MNSETQVSPLVSRLWGRFFSLQERLEQKEPQYAEAIRGQELKEIRSRLGLEIDWLADHYGLPPEEIEMWEGENQPVAPSIADELVKLAMTTQTIIENETDRLQRASIEHRTVIVYSTDTAYHRVHPEAAPLPASWHRAVYLRVAENVGDMSIGVG